MAPDMTSLTARRNLSRRSAWRSNLTAALTRLVPAAIVIWAVMAAFGYLLTRPWHETVFERRDAWINGYLADHRTGLMNSTTHVVSYAAETYTVIIVGLVFFVGMRLRLGRWRESMFLTAAIVGEVLIFIATTLVIHRHRPPVHRLDVVPPTSSYPSGHTAASIVLYAGLALIALRTSTRRWLRVVAVWAAVVIPIGVAFSRLYRGMHYPTDVLGSLLLAFLWLTVTVSVVLKGRG
jgi:membrane-associated phospholipid phosphatase